MNAKMCQVTVLTIVLIVFVTVLSISAIVLDDGGTSYNFTSVRGEDVTMYGGDGIYKYDNVEKALMMRAYDMFYLIGAIPLLIISLVLYTKRSYIGYFSMISVLFFLIYSFIISSIGTAYNEFFLVYMMIYVISFFDLVLIIQQVSFDELKDVVIPKVPRKAIAIFVIFLAGYFIVSWLIIDIRTLLFDNIHPNLSLYTTADTNITDLSIFAPLSITGGILLLRKRPFGVILTIGQIIMAFMTLVALTIYSVLNTVYNNLSLYDIEFILPFFALVCLAFGIISVRNLAKKRFTVKN